MSLEDLQRLLGKGLKAEPYAKAEFEKLKSLAATGIKDGQTKGLAAESRFTLTYDACHSLALASLRYQGLRSENRTLVFLCLAHTLNFPPNKIRMLSDIHKRRNLALYEGEIEVDEKFLKELTEIAQELAAEVAKMPNKD